MKKSFGLLLFVLFASFAIVACDEATTAAPTTAAPTTVAPTTAAPTTVAPTTVAPTTVAPTTVPTTAAPTTIPPTTEATTAAPTTFSPAIDSYLSFAASDWAVAYWAPGDETNTAEVVATNALVNGYGTYTVSLDFTGVTGGKANGFAFLAVMIDDGEANLPGSYMTIDEVLINGVEVTNLGSTYTSSDDEIVTRTNLYNTWVSGTVEGRTADGRYLDITAVPLDVSTYTDVTSISVTYTIVEGLEIAPQAYLQFADNDWGEAQAWYDGFAESNVEVDGYGQYTLSLDFTGTTNGYANGIAFFDVEISNGEIFYPKSAMTIDSVVINGIPLAIGLTYTTTDNDNDTRVNLFNSWVGTIESGRTADGIIEGISAIPVDASGIAEIETIEVTFTLGDGLLLGEVGPEPLPRQGTTAYLAVSDSGWAVGYWGTANSGNTAGIVANTPVITGYGQYTTSLDFTGVAGGVLPDITFLGLEIYGGEQYFPYCIVQIDSMSINGVDVTELLGNSYTTSDNGFETRVNLYNTWVSEITGNRFGAGLTLEDLTAAPLDGTAYTNITSMSITFTITEGEFYLEVIDEFEGYELPESFNAFMMFSDTSGAWESYAAGTSGDCSVIGDGVYEVSLSATDIEATGQAVAGQVFLVDIEGLGKAMRFLETMDDENNTDLVVEVRVFVDGTEVTANNSNILVGDIEGNDRLRLELYNEYGTGTMESPVVAPELLTPASEIVVWFKLVGTGLNTGASTDWPAVE
ncbi:MAG: hypothetical protein PHI01_03830 [Candidatus Izemoplasmatales bacterium]|nr:hypothetical protein [Candidatus Izemoplasmatales bacterium]